MSCALVTLLLSCFVLVSVSCHDVRTHRHRHERSHQEEYDLDRLLNRLDNHLPATTATPSTQSPVPVTESNSLWEEEENSSPTAWGLDSGRWSKILRKDEGKRLEDVTDEEGEEDDEEDEDSKGLIQQADSSRSWVSEHISQIYAGINLGFKLNCTTSLARNCPYL